ncbi:uncharacterized protein BDW47DRAFT_97866 [Aspergillus candidus]|uniref:Uncharacterized protein n=1 Tax=Aspergillus candidus TaxID=41067 RepID=A0A2I2FN91_ASPCN|nr:hypothetical protein BDW47DRAFT_97866 [Aspergillus candidus]PLB42092.1 hypothetical protein BDW47DRAFT_97866 [Aspergillus candidus]
MQSLWTRAGSAQSSTCRCVSCLSTGASGLTSRTASAASKRRLRIGNSITAFYTSIFAAAALADARAKNQRRLEWTEKIAAVKEEVDKLMDEEQRILQAISPQQLATPFRRISQIRQYSTAAARRPSERPRVQWPSNNLRRNPRRVSDSPMFSDDLEFEDGSRSGGATVEVEQESRVVTEILAENEAPIFEDADDGTGLSNHYDAFPEWLWYDPIRLKAIRKLALRQLAIRLLLRPAIAHTYEGIRMNYAQDSSVPQLKVADLLKELSHIRHRMRHLKTSREAYIDDLTKDFRLRDMDEVTRERAQLEEEMRSDTEIYLAEEMSLAEYLLRLSNNIMRSKDPDRSTALRLMLLAFYKTKQHDLCHLVMKTILPHKFPLNASLILTILTFYRKDKDLRSFDRFLNMLCGQGYPIDMYNLSYYVKEVINGIEIAVPPVQSANAVAYTVLIVSCLRFNQPERAEAYLQAARRIGYMDHFPNLNAYLAFYANRHDWEMGVQTMKRCLAFISSSTAHEEVSVEKMILLMTNLCDSCERYDVSEAIIVAAVDSGFDWRCAMEHLRIESAIDPHSRRWHVAEDASPTSLNARDKATWEKCYAFANAFGEQLNELALDEHKSSARQWQKLMGTYAQQVLDSVLAGKPAEYRNSNPAPEPSSTSQQESLLEQINIEDDRFNVDEEEFHEAKRTAEAQKGEITSLRSEVSHLKQLIYKLHQTTLDSTSIAQSASRDLEQLKAQLASTNTILPPKAAALDEAPPAPPHLSVRYIKSSS